MDYTRLGRTGLEVSRIALGCMTYGGPSRGNHSWTLDEEASRPLIRRAVELGITGGRLVPVTGQPQRRQGTPLRDGGTLGAVWFAERSEGRA